MQHQASAPAPAPEHEKSHCLTHSPNSPTLLGMRKGQSLRKRPKRSCLLSSSSTRASSQRCSERSRKWTPSQPTRLSKFSYFNYFASHDKTSSRLSAVAFTGHTQSRRLYRRLLPPFTATSLLRPSPLSPTLSFSPTRSHAHSVLTCSLRREGTRTCANQCRVFCVSMWARRLLPPRASCECHHSSPSFSSHDSHVLKRCSLTLFLRMSISFLRDSHLCGKLSHLQRD